MGHSYITADWNFWPDELDVPQIWDACLAFELSGVELGVYAADVELSRDRLDLYRNLAADTGLAPVVTLFSMPAAKWPEGGLASKATRADAVQAVVEAAHRSLELDITTIGLWPGADADGDWQWMVDSVFTIADAIDPTQRLCVEYKPHDLVADADAVERLVAETTHDRVGVLLDTGHGHWGDENVDSLPERFGNRLFHVHLGDDSPGGSDADLPPGRVHDFDGFMRGIAESGYTGHLSFDLYEAVATGASATGTAAMQEALDHITAAAEG